MTRLLTIISLLFATPAWAKDYTCAWEFGDKVHMRTYEVAGKEVKEKDGPYSFEVIQDNKNFFSFMKHWYADEELGYMTAIHIINKKNGEYVSHQVHSPYKTYKLIGRCEEL